MGTPRVPSSTENERAEMELTTNWQEIDFKKIVDLYDSVAWSNYTNETNSLKKAFENSSYVVVAIQDGNVCGLARSISDDVSIHYLQDILINPKYQRKGIGRKLFSNVLKRFYHVRTHMLLTDDEEKQLKFYKSLGYSNTKELQDIQLNAFVQMKGVELK